MSWGYVAEKRNAMGECGCEKGCYGGMWLRKWMLWGYVDEKRDVYGGMWLRKGKLWRYVDEKRDAMGHVAEKRDPMVVCG